MSRSLSISQSPRAYDAQNLSRSQLNTRLKQFWLNDYCQGGGVIDDTAGIRACIAAAKATGVRARINFHPDTFLFTDSITFDASFDLVGENGQFCVFYKGGNFPGFIITGGAQQSLFSDFTLTGPGGGTGVGMHVIQFARGSMNRVVVLNQGGHGVHFDGAAPTGFNSVLTNISIGACGGDALRLENTYELIMNGMDLSSSAGWGFNLVSGNYNRGISIFSQGNTAGGNQIATIQNVLELYGEANVGPDHLFTETSQHNKIIVLGYDSYSTDLDNRGVANSIDDLSGLVGLSVERIQPTTQNTNTAGRTISIRGGAAGGTAKNGGDLRLNGGDESVGGDTGYVQIGQFSRNAEIKFATPNTSTDTQTLDAYEETTSVTVTMTATTGTITLTSGANGDQLCLTRVGNRVSGNGHLAVSSVSAPTGVLQVVGLPIAAANAAAVTVTADSLAATAAGQICGKIVAAGNTIRITKYAAGAQAALAGDVQAGSEFYIEFSYQV